MKYKIHTEIKDSYPLGSLLSNDSIDNLNKVFGTHYTRDQVNKRIKVLRRQEKFKFWDKLMRTKPRFDRKGNEKK